MSAKWIIRSLFSLAVLLIASACGTQRNYTYLKDAPRDEIMVAENNYSSRIFPGDRLYIYVHSQTPESAVPFNEETNRSDYNARTTGNNWQTRQYKPKGRLVGTDGTIYFPLLGSLSTTGLTTDSLAHAIEQRLIESNYVNDPIVTVSLMNFRTTVIGEVVTPRQIHADGNRLTILEAIAQCGDITMDGMRDRVVVVRTTDGKETIDTVNLTSRSLLNSPYYYLQQNDIVYVPPTKKKQRKAYRNEDWPTYLSTGLAAIRFAYTTIYRYMFDPTTRKVLGYD